MPLPKQLLQSKGWQRDDRLFITRAADGVTLRAFDEGLANHSTPDAFDLVAAYAFGIARNHPFIDCNKRTAWVGARVFLLLHGWDRDASDAESYLSMLQLAGGEMPQAAFAAGLRAHSKER